jgi:hydrogenase maturation protein HypF
LAYLKDQAIQKPKMIDSRAGLQVTVSGVVQGVGFRPFVFTLATAYSLSGSVWNTSSGVEIEIFGAPPDLNAFLIDLRQKPPPLARIDNINSKTIPFRQVDAFTILSSLVDEGQFVPISPDMSICAECQRELFDPTNRRYRYPFINCTHCGPRFSIIQDVPYDRRFTTMARFEMCQACRAEYEDPFNRRFHAQPVACPDCGPRVTFVVGGQIVGKFEGAISTARRYLQDGKIIAIKGIGGFHLACDATNASAVEELRKRKQRSDRPFALMSFDLETTKQKCQVSDAEARELTSPQHPIVLLQKKHSGNFPESIAPAQNHLGFMLPYTPLHLLLLEPEDDFPDTLVMTSGNLSDEPIAYEDADAQNRLGSIADGFLLHNREIHMRVDDSVTRLIGDQPSLIRRSRGFAPNGLVMGRELPQILACGAELKNTFCLSRSNYAFLSHHIGDLENYETLKSFETGVEHYQRLFRVQPRFLAADLHPDYLATQYAFQRAQTEGLPILQVQHHHAHLAACLAEHHRPADETAIGLIFDGTGYGSDGTIWGGEILLGSCQSFDRVYHLEEMPLPGGDTAIRNPAKIALSYLQASGLDWFEDLLPVQSLTTEQLKMLKTQVERKINTPLTSSMGRLFDAVAALIGVRQQVNYEGQAAIELENLCALDEEIGYVMPLSEESILISPLIQAVVADYRKRVSIQRISARFHNAIAQMCLQVCLKIRSDTGINVVALSGGVWQNRTLVCKTQPLLETNGFSVLRHHQVPTNDGGIALGQLMVASATFKE